MNSILLTIIGIIVLFVLITIGLFNSIIRLKNKVENAWSQIDVQLKRRFDLIPNLVDTVKGYMKHEKQVLTEITNARANLMKGPIEKRAEASNQITGALKSLFAVAENYPDLKASENFKMLQEELSGTENKISYARQHYNDMVMMFNTKIELFPNKILADILNFNKKEFFKTDDEEKKPIKTKF